MPLAEVAFKWGVILLCAYWFAGWMKVNADFHESRINQPAYVRTAGLPILRALLMWPWHRPAPPLRVLLFCWAIATGLFYLLGVAISSVEVRLSIVAAVAVLPSLPLIFGLVRPR